MKAFRYGLSSRRNRERDVIVEAQAIHPNTYVTRDFDRFLIRRDKPVHKVIESD